MPNQLSLLVISFFFIVSSCSNSEYKPIKPIKQDKFRVWLAHVEQGELVFEQHCKYCHKIGRKDVPDWKGLVNHIPGGEETIIQFIASSSRLREDSNWYAINIKQEYNNTPFEHEFREKLTKQDFHNLMVYVKHEFGGKVKRY